MRTFLCTLLVSVLSCAMNAPECLAEPPEVSPEIVSEVLEGLRTEEDEERIINSLGVLGRSGRLEALGLIQTHAVSPRPKLRQAGRRALAIWLIVNDFIASPNELPDPPHPFYTQPPPEAPSGPAARSVAADRTGVAENAPAPIYVPPRSDGVPTGFELVSEPRMRLVVGGAATLGALYLASAIGGTAAMGEHADPFLWLPLAGPFIPAGKAYAADDINGIDGLSKLGAAFLMIGGAGQLAGAALLIAGLAGSDERLRSTGATPRAATIPRVSVSPTSATLTWSF